MMKQKVKFGLVGAGGIAQAYAQAFETCVSAELIAVTDVRLEAAKAMAEHANCPYFNSHQAMAAAVDLDAVVICTPPVSHPEISIYFLNRDINVLCEKPLSISVDSAREMVEAARRSNAMLTMGSKFRYADDVVKAKSIVMSGSLGEVVLFENAFTVLILLISSAISWAQFLMFRL
jgi:predicted dehydrogenase